MPHGRPPKLSTVEIQELVAKYLPAWLAACSADADTIVMHERSFGTSADELVLLACAIKFAAQQRKNVHITIQKGGKTSLIGHHIDAGAVFREKGVPRSPAKTSRRRSAT